MKFRVKDMDGLLKENGNSSSDSSTTNTLKTCSVTCVQSVIQPTQPSVIQTASGSVQPSVLTKGNVILLSKPNTVIQTAQGNIQTLQLVVETQGTDDEDSLSPRDGILKKKHNNHQNNASRIKLVDTLSPSDLCTKIETSGSEDDSNLDSELSSHSLSMSNHYQTVLSNAVPSQNDDMHNLSSITMTSANTTGTGTILHYAGQDGQFFVPGEVIVVPNSNNGDNSQNVSLSIEDQVKKRELRLLKNREAARECRRKKKEYIKCLENRVAVLETQNKALIDELKALKELYCSQKPD